jgi:hypothetical protein
MSSIIRSRGEYHIFNTYFFSKLEAIATKVTFVWNFYLMVSLLT